MGRHNAPTHSGKLVQLILRGRRSQALVRTNDDWQSLGLAASRMLFWCGGFIHGCRCETNEMHFAVQVAHTSIGAIAQHIAGSYGKHLRQSRGWRGAVFKHYRVTPFDGELYLDDLVMWLHRPAEPRPRGKLPVPVWTGEAAYLSPPSLAWITTDRVLQELSIGAPGPAAYRRRKTEPIAAEVIEVLTRRRPTRKQRRAVAPNSHDPARESNERRPSVDAIARAVAEYSHVAFDAMRSRSRKRDLSQAKAIATVLCARNGATVSAAARLFNRSRSTLIEQADYYRDTQPQIFADAESALAAFLDKTRP
jgi:hypothetical protein